jgi:ketosteroid isomerase-like protein
VSPIPPRSSSARKVGHAVRDEGIRADTTYEGHQRKSAAPCPGRHRAGNASQFSDGASARVVMDADAMPRRGMKPLGLFRGFAVAGCEPDEMGIGPVFAVPKVLQRAGLKVEDIDLWELNEAFAVQVLYCMPTARHSRWTPQRQRRRDRGRASVWRQRPATDRPCADRRPPSRREVRRGDDVHRWRHGRGRAVRDRRLEHAGPSCCSG